MKNEGALLSNKRIYYRGKLNSCNYTCSYCPFGKKSHLTATTQDEQAWNRFITAIEQATSRKLLRNSSFRSLPIILTSPRLISCLQNEAKKLFIRARS